MSECTDVHQWRDYNYCHGGTLYPRYRAKGNGEWRPYYRHEGYRTH